jgi:perosamine synthetase
MIDLFYPFVPDEAIEQVTETLKSRWIGQAHKVDKFEKNFSELFNVKYPLALNSGTSSLEMAYELVGLKSGDEVITTPFTCTATNIPLLRRGVKLVWADILPTTMNIDPSDVKRKMTPNTKAVIQVHMGGIGSDVGNLGIPVISDAAQALGIFTGDYTCNSFQAIKHITTGDGGMITLNNPREYKRAKLMRWFGIDRELKEKNNWQCYKERKMIFDIEILGFKFHMNDISAGMGIAGLKYYGQVLEHRKRLFDIYKKELKGIPGIELVDGEPNTYWLCTVLVDRRDDFARKMFENEIDSNIVHMRNDNYKVFGGKCHDLPVMNSLEDKYICLPLNTKVTEQDVHNICSLIRKGW